MRYAIAGLLAITLASRLHAQEIGADTASSRASEKPFRNPHKAVVIGSLIPGAGHIYAGEYWKGVLTYEATVSAIGMGVMTYTIDKCTFDWSSSCKSGPAWPHQLVGIVAVGAGIWTWASTARDAGRAAQRANERHRRRFESVVPVARPFSGPAHTTQIGVSMDW
jgi:hypothetical protein